MENIILKGKTKWEKIRNLFLVTLKWFFILPITMQSLQISAQSQFINLKMNNVSLHEILLEIKRQSGKDIIYNNNLTDIFKNETIELRNAKTEDVLKKVLEGKNLNYRIVDDVIIIEPEIVRQNPEYSKHTIITCVVTDSLNNPIPFASVYLSKTTEGTYTDNNGVYSLTIPMEGFYEMIVSCIGYKLNSQVINVEGKIQKINVKLSSKIFLLNEVTIEANDKNRRRNYSQFIKFFIGETNNSQGCKILNPEDLHLYRDNENNILKGYSLKPLIIENKSLGYRIDYDLTDFSYNYKTELVRFSGYNHFQQLAGTEKRNKIHKTNRLVAYYGSKMHFMRALFSDSLSSESFKIYDCKYDSVRKEYSEIKPIQPDIIRIYNSDNSVSLLYNGILLVRYTDKYPELAQAVPATSPGILLRNDGGIYGGTEIAVPVGNPKQAYKPKYAEPEQYDSFIYFSDTLKVFQNGYYFNPYSITWGGIMANERIADMLPLDFVPDENVIAKSDSILKKKTPVTPDFIETESSQIAEKVYLQTDRIIYTSGDDIWYKAYVIDPSTNLLSVNTNNLHVELISPDSKIVLSRTLRIEEGLGNGDFLLPDSIPSGQYRIRAYTNHMRNYDDNFFFLKEITVINPYDDSNGLNKNPEGINNRIDIGFFPEGGSLVENVTSTVAFKAVNALGKGCDVTVSLYSYVGELIAEFKSLHHGMGYFNIKPLPGYSYYAVVKSVDGTETRAELPRCFPAGVTIKTSVTPDFNLLLTICTNDATLPSVSGREFTVSLSSRNLINRTAKIKISSLENSFILPIDSLPEGIMKVTLYDFAGMPLSEKLVYLQSNDEVQLNVTTDKKEYKSREKVTAEISLSDDTTTSGAGVFSFSAADARFTDNSSPFPTSIASWFLLESDVKGIVEEPFYYFDPSNNKRFRDLDLLLMTQGWRDFRWKYDSIASFKSETGFTVSGKVKTLIGNKSLGGAKLNIGLFGSGAAKFLSSYSDSIGIFKVENIDITGRNNMFISATGRNERPVGRIFLDSVFYKPPEIVDLKQLNQTMLINKESYSLFRQEASYRLETKRKYKLSDTIKVGEVFVTAIKTEPPESIKIQESRRVYGIPDKELVVTPAQENFAGDVFDFISGRIPGVRLIKNYDLQRQNPENIYFIINGQFGPALILVDGMRIDSTSFFSLFALQVSMIDRIDVLNASPLYGMSGANGVINIITRMGSGRPPEKLGPNAATVVVKGYDAPRIYYSPKYDDMTEQAFVPDSRETIYWEPNIIVEKNRKSTLQYYNADNPMKIKIVIEGITEEGIPVTGKINYDVK
jgi:hypothetical protein